MAPSMNMQLVLRTAMIDRVCSRGFATRCDLRRLERPMLAERFSSASAGPPEVLRGSP